MSQSGGVYKNKNYVVKGMQYVEADKEYLLFLNNFQTDKNTPYFLVNPTQGMLEIKEDTLMSSDPSGLFKNLTKKSEVLVQLKDISNGAESIDQGLNSGVTEEPIQEKISDVMKAEKDAQELIKIIKEKDAAKLFQLLHISELDLEGVNEIIEGFHVNFDLNTLSAVLYYDGYAMSPEGGQYEFILTDKNLKEYSNENSLVIRYEEDGSRVYHNPYIRYFPYAEKMILRYLDLVDKKNVTGLAGFLNPDDVDVPIWVAEEAISQYENYFGLEDLSVRYINRFIFMAEDGKLK